MINIIHKASLSVEKPLYNNSSSNNNNAYLAIRNSNAFSQNNQFTWREYAMKY
jgi:hypothetical protein